jgi:hypothetical protein
VTAANSASTVVRQGPRHDSTSRHVLSSQQPFVRLPVAVVDEDIAGGDYVRTELCRGRDYFCNSEACSGRRSAVVIHNKSFKINTSAT